MFGKKCSKCNSKISENYDFCPSCGKNLRSKYDSQDYGILGKNDFMDEPNIVKDFNIPINKIFANVMREFPAMMKLIEKQMREFDENLEKERDKIDNNLNIQFFVNGKPVVSQKKILDKPKVKTSPNLGMDKMEKLSNLPKKEPSSKIRRLSRKLIYDIAVPGVKNIEDILISQLENSIEIKAISKDKVYSKILNINLPILSYNLSKGHLILELKTK